MTTTLHPLAEDYLARLDRAAAVLPDQERAELVAEIRSHLGAGLATTAGDADVRNLLDDLGEPEEIIAAARVDGAPPDAARTAGWGPPPSPDPPTGWGPMEIAAVLGLTVGAVVLPVVGPLVGLVLALTSPRWSGREKVVATALSLLPVLSLAVGLGLSVVVSPSTVEQDPRPSPSVSVERAP